MKLFAISAFALALTTTAVTAQTAENVIKDTTVSVTAIAGPLDFTLEGNRDNVTELEVVCLHLTILMMGLMLLFGLLLGLIFVVPIR